MPELPEVETIRRELEKTILDKKIKEVFIHNPKVIKEISADKFKHELEGKIITRVLRRGKLLIIELSGPKALTVHLRLTGQLVYPGNNKNSRVSFMFSDRKILDFNDARLLGELKITDDWRNLKFIKNLGPEPFDLKLSDFAERLNRKKTKIKILLMDQSFLAGVGNLYAAEALFMAKIAPQRSAGSLDAKEKERLFTKLKQVLNQAIRLGGSSVDDYVRVSGQKGNFAAHLKVYGRKDEPCLVCGSKIKRITLSGRGTYFCPKCQKSS